MAQHSRESNPADQLTLGLSDCVAVDAAEVPPSTARRKARPGERDLSTRPHTRLKLDCLVDYLPQWFAIASNKSTDTHYIDAFAGAGHYPDGTATAKGSPVIACEAALSVIAAAQLRGRTWNPHLRFVERSKATVEELRTALGRFDGRLDYRVVEGDAAKELPDLVAQTLGHPTLAFIDPDGFAPVTFDLLRSFGGRRTMTEVLLSVDAQGIRRAHARGETAAFTAFSGGDWWPASLGPDGLIDLHSYFREFCSRLGGVGRPFPYASVQHLEFLSNHAHRAIIQGCMSAEGPKRWNAAMRRSREATVVIDAFFPQLDERALVDAILQRWHALEGQSAITFSRLINAMSDLAWSEPTAHQALLFLRERGLVDWTSRLGRDAVPRPRFRFDRGWPEALVWDGQRRSEHLVQRLAAVAPGR